MPSFSNHTIKLLLLACLALPVLPACTQIFSTEVDSSARISDTAGNFTDTLGDATQFGYAVASIGDLESDGVIDLAVGAAYDDEGETDAGAIWILFMDDNGAVDIQRKIGQNLSGFGSGLEANDHFGTAIATLGDLNGDGFQDIAVGAPGDDDGGNERGAVWILFLNFDGQVLARQKISHLAGALLGGLQDGDRFGSALANAGDLNGDGVAELVVGAPYDDTGGNDRGAMYILYLNPDGTVQAQQKISSTQGGLAAGLQDNDQFAWSVTGLGDIDADGIPDLAVGAPGDDDGGSNRGAVWLVYLNANGTVKDEAKISQSSGEFDGFLLDGDRFGSAVADLGDMNNDGVNELVVGAPYAYDGGLDRGALWVMFLRRDGSVISSSKISSSLGNFAGPLRDNDRFAGALAGIGDLDGDGINDLASGASLTDDGGTDRGALWVLFMAPAVPGVRVDPNTNLFTLLAGN